MTEETAAETVGELPNGSDGGPAAPGVLTGLVWALWVASLVAVGARVVTGGGWELSGLVVVDGLTVLMWTVVTFFSGIVHSYSRRYMAGSERVTRFFAGLFGFTLAVLVLVAADHVVLFGTAWLAMGLVMAALISTARGWGQARRAASYTRRYLLAGSALLALALALLATSTDTTAISEITARAGTVPDTTWLVAASALLLAAMVQSALIPFHTWLLSSMTAPTPASALMHAGFVNAGGILLLRFAPVVDRAGAFMLVIVVAGALSALVGKLLKSVRPEVKHQLACSTTGQMGFMILQAGLGFFGAAITHLILHGFYKAYLFLGSGEQVTQTSPTARSENGRTGLVGGLVTLVTALAGGVLFAVLTGKGTSVDSGLLLTGLVALTTLHAAQVAVRRQSLPVTLRYGVVAVVFLPAVAVYAGAYQLVTGLLSDVPLVTTPADLTVVHVAVAVAFGVAYVAIEMGVYRRSRRLYVLLVNATQPPTATLLTATEEYNEH